MRLFLLLCAVLVLSAHHRPRHGLETIWFKIPLASVPAARLAYQARDGETIGICRRNLENTHCYFGSSLITPALADAFVALVPGATKHTRWPPAGGWNEAQ